MKPKPCGRGWFKKLNNLLFLLLSIYFSFFPTAIFSQTELNSQNPNSTPFNINFIHIAPLVTILAALIFGLFAAIIVRNNIKRTKKIQNNARQQIANMRAHLDKYENLLANLPEILLIYHSPNDKPLIFGQTELVLSNISANNIANFTSWLSEDDSNLLNKYIEELKNKAKPFELSLTTKYLQQIIICGHIMGANAAITIKKPFSHRIKNLREDELAQKILTHTNEAGFLLNKEGEFIYINRSCQELLDNFSQNKADNNKQIIAKKIIIELINKLNGKNLVKQKIELINGQKANIILFKIENLIVAFLNLADGENNKIDNNGFEYIEAINLPVAIFNGQQKLLYFNSAYCDLWKLDEDWLKSGVSETAILNKLHTRSQLPSVVNYRKWRQKHLEYYNSKKEQTEEWYLPDGRIIKLRVVPILHGKEGGVIFIFEDISESHALKVRHNALINVQSETLNALSEAVAVFGTNGRLTLANPRLSALWGVPLNQLENNLHIDEVGDYCAKALPEDGKKIWENLKREIIDLNPTRIDKSARIKRSDGVLIDYKITRLPDGQTMFAFLDVTKSAAYETMLKERNEALLTADRLKDEFVKNVSYELRSPLTNIIGFADMLNSDIAGELTEKQRQYTSYIKNSSQRLGVLIDNILDLATAEAGVLELNFEQVDIERIIEQAKSGLVGLVNINGQEGEINLIVNIADNLPPLIADKTRMVQILYNLLSNAVRFSEPGSEILLDISSHKEHIIFTIEDEGEGISEEMKQSLFERFRGKSSKHYQRGMGLGLTIVKTFVKLHGGTIVLEKRKPKGTRVIVTLPSNVENAKVTNLSA